MPNNTQQLIEEAVERIKNKSYELMEDETNPLDGTENSGRISETNLDIATRISKEVVTAELKTIASKSVDEERKRLLKVVARTPITGWDTDGTRVASRLLEALSPKQHTTEEVE